MDELSELKVFYEQQAYAEIRAALQEDYLKEPVAFVEHFGKRPEDLSGRELRDFYPHFLIQQRQLSSVHSGFRKKFMSGELFSLVVEKCNLQRGDYAYV